MSVVVKEQLKVKGKELLDFIKNSNSSYIVSQHTEVGDFFQFVFHLSTNTLYSKVTVKEINGVTDISYDDMYEQQMNTLLSQFTEHKITQNIKGNFDVLERAETNEKIVLTIRRK